MTPLDVSTLGTIIGKLQNASSATAHGLHEDARDDAKRAGELLIGMLGWYVGLGDQGLQSLQAQQIAGLQQAAQAAQGLGVPHWSDTAWGAQRAMGMQNVAKGRAEPDPLVAARERLGPWLAAEEGRYYMTQEGYRTHKWMVELIHRSSVVAQGNGETLADAMIAALDAANGGG